MSPVTHITDDFGRTIVPLDERDNNPGTLTIDGDVYSHGPVCILHIECTGEDYENELDFGTFRVKMPPGQPRVFTNLSLTREQALVVADAIRAQVADAD